MLVTTFRGHAQAIAQDARPQMASCKYTQAVRKADPEQRTGCLNRFEKWMEAKRASQGYRVDNTGPALLPTLIERASFQQLELWARKHHVTQRE